MDRSEINRALAKCLAYKQCGRDGSAEMWAARLVGLLQCADILQESDDVRDFASGRHLP